MHAWQLGSDVELIAQFMDGVEGGERASHGGRDPELHGSTCA
jgi:hypothetical protein